MITDVFDNQSPAIIQPPVNAQAPEVDVCIVTFSYVIETFVREHMDVHKIGSLWSATGETPVYGFSFQSRTFAFYKTLIGAPASAALLEDTPSVLRTRRYVVFGGAGCLNREIAHGKVMVPTEAYRDEGTSYHYAPPSDCIAVRGADVVARFMAQSGIPYIQGKTWTTDAFYRETVNNVQRRKEAGCISVEMEGAALQAVCDHRGWNLYMFFTSGDLLDAPQWEERHAWSDLKGTQHDVGHFDIALELALAVANGQASA